MRSNVKLYQRGFSILEVILACTLILALAAVVVPTGRRSIEEHDVTRAADDCRSIAEGLIEYVADTGCVPTGVKGAPTWSWLRGPGADCRFRVFPEGRAGQISWFLEKDAMNCGARWGGPYLDGLQSDPWGRHYVVLLSGAGRERRAVRHVWVLSAGPDGVIETRPEDRRPVGDDIGMTLDL